MPLFGPKQKTPQEIVRLLRENLQYLSLLKVDNKEDKKAAKASEEVSAQLTAIKGLLCGGGGGGAPGGGSAEQDPPQSELIAAQLAQELYNNNVLLLLMETLSKIDFEGRKDAAQIFNNLLRRQLGARSPTVEHICLHREILGALLAGYDSQEVALNCGIMLRECFRHEELARIVLHSEAFYKFFDYVELSTFDIASDAFTTFKMVMMHCTQDLLTKHKALSAEFLDQNYDRIFSRYQRLLESHNYVTRRQALRLLGELLLDAHNFATMTRYISSADNLKLMMNMLKEKSRNIQFEAFHVFKVFVANPYKPRPVQEILVRNRDKLVDFLSRFHSDRSEDEQFSEEKTYLIKQIQDLKELDPLPGGSPGRGTVPLGGGNGAQYQSVDAD